MKRRWISSPRASSANWALTTALCTASVISMNRTGRWNATTGTLARAHAATTGAGTSRQLEPSSTAKAAMPCSITDAPPGGLVARLLTGPEPGGQHELAALEEIVRVGHLDDMRPADLEAQGGVADDDLRQRPAHHGQIQHIGKTQHDASSCIITERPTHCPLRRLTSNRKGGQRSDGRERGWRRRRPRPTSISRV